jgi:hypothetical protein
LGLLSNRWMTFEQRRKNIGVEQRRLIRHQTGLRKNRRRSKAIDSTSLIDILHRHKSKPVRSVVTSTSDC